MSQKSNESKPLAGVRVLDFTHAAAGPFASMFLADLGAQVYKIEKPKGGDGARTMGVPVPARAPNDSDYFVSLNRNKQGLAIDLTAPEGIVLARELVKQCDVVLENFRPGVMDRLGLGFDALKALRPGLVYASISAFGSSGPWVDRPANDIIMQSVSGLMGITGEVGGGPVRIGAPISDFSSGLFMLSGVLAALFARAQHPEGQHVEVAMLEASLNMMSNYIPSVADMGAQVARLGRGHAQIVPYQAFICADGEYLMIGAFTRGFWVNLCHALGHPEWITDAKYATNPARLQHRAELTAKLQEIFITQPRTHWTEVITKADVPNSPVYELHDAIHSDQVRHLNSLMPTGSDEAAVRVVRNPMRVKAWGEYQAIRSPGLGENTRSVLKELLGKSDSEVDSLVQRNVVVDAQ
ncbi:CoA transferase (plasmid) [Diaphorobacter sp. HDW4B]|uniref:CaiB/BaiF CoA transferase family protein n=1 Tax=Diaphorobacter sp. HDW4B TaxID=2714925 RepID=UPI0014076F9D|nr:CaiB/BaiF CoA-transferase family protein [Diaphorobacter sp. HDW4B]QIL73892.1 CoA transferase [Diaphorobacter sp. HDW4B]